ncbi:uncharacterized protein F4817DRAFT_47851 [Daldinia loculata]|uniref:uncharacterized protein n=1 Tax=Daldinia loculata TaxID=103429 RepID=UPI0020C29F17|nr:uncharacterized protein F4817DRAFT_47851 [Daldinia loculata]KAI1648911.1 hypothetical protein F4817DRAFT_47851 [Daldinia loculata]
MDHVDERLESSLPYPLESTIPASPDLKPKRSAKPVEHKKHHAKLTRKHISTPDDPYAFLKHFDTIFLIDDSKSMEKHWGEVGMLLEKIAPICTERDPNGVDIYFVNHRPRGYLMYAALGFDADRSGYLHIGQSVGVPEMRDNVAGIFGSIKKLGSHCRLDRRLSYILDRYVHEYERSRRDRGTGSGNTVRPLNLIVITAGVTDDNPYDTLIRTARKLDILGAPPYQVGVQFFRVGDDEGARQALDFADDGLSDALDIRDIVDTTTWGGKLGDLSPDAVLKVVLGAVERSIDKQKA